MNVKERMMQPEMFNKLIEYLEKRMGNLEYIWGNAEPGYVDGLVFLGDWNCVSDKLHTWIGDTLEINCFFDDENWQRCSHCYKAVQYHKVTSECCEATCLTCVDEDWDDWGDDIIADYAEIADGHTAAQLKDFPVFPVFLLSKLPEAGFMCLDDEDSEACQRFQSGLHPGQNDDPNKVLKSLSKTFPGAEVIFVVNDHNMFTVTWSVWIRYKVEE